MLSSLRLRCTGMAQTVNAFSVVNNAVRANSSATSAGRILSLDRMTVIPGARKKRKRVGRGVGSGRGKTSSHGHQRSLATPRQFEGGQTTFWKRMPKSGFNNPNARDMAYLNVGKIQQWIDQKRLSVASNTDGDGPVMITMRDLREAGLISRIKDGVKLLANDKNTLTTPIHLEVSMASGSAIEAIEAAGGTVTCVHFNTLALRALLMPYKFTLLPLRARPNPKIIDYYLDRNKSGYLSPEIQVRNLKLFGYVTSEDRCRREHEAFMVSRRKHLRLAKNAANAMTSDTGAEDDDVDGVQQHA